MLCQCTVHYDCNVSQVTAVWIRSIQYIPAELQVGQHESCRGALVVGCIMGHELLYLNDNR